MDMEKLRSLLIQVKQISNNYKKIAEISGETFNVFRTLGLESSEVRMHSAFIAELLNPNGSHGQGDIFLKCFLEQLRARDIVTDIVTENAVVEVEKYIGLINDDYTEGGRIDILISDINGEHIIIENKIDAKDQKKQLVRYHHFAKNASIFYLTLDGAEPTEISTGSILEKDQYTPISYETDILQWLKVCRKEAVSLPIIRETISQYINLIKYLTNQTTEDKMKEEVETLILNNPESADSIDKCYDVLQSIIKETKSRFEALIEKKRQKDPISLDSGVKVITKWGEDGDGVHFGYQAFKGDVNISSSDEVKSYVEILKKLDNGFRSGGPWIGWCNPDPFKRRDKFEKYDKKAIVKMYTNKALLEKFVDNLMEQENKVREAFLEKLKFNTHNN